MKLHCNICGTAVSTDVPDTTIVRGWIECPGCIHSTTTAKISKYALNSLLNELNARAVAIDSYEYGLPLAGAETEGYLREAVLQWLLKEKLL